MGPLLANELDLLNIKKKVSPKFEVNRLIIKRVHLHRRFKTWIMNILFIMEFIEKSYTWFLGLPRRKFGNPVSPRCHNYNGPMAMYKISYIYDQGVTTAIGLY